MGDNMQLSIDSTEIQLTVAEAMEPLETKARQNLERLLPDEEDRMLIEMALGLRPY